MNPENDTGVLVNFLDQTLEESRRLREDLKHGQPEEQASAPPDEASPPEKGVGADPAGRP